MNKTDRFFLSLDKLALLTRCRFAQYTENGWKARRTEKNATHKLLYTVVYGQLDRPVSSIEINWTETKGE